MSGTKEEICKGDRIGLSFNLGKIDHPVYGKADDLHGVMNFVRRYGDYQIPAIVNDPVGREKVIDDLFQEYKFMWENDTDDMIKDRIRDFVLIAAFVNPSFDHYSELGQALAILMVIGFTADDVLDEFEDVSKAGFGFAEMDKMLKYLHDIRIGVYARPEDIPNIFPALSAVTKGYWMCQKRWLELVPDYLEKCEPLDYALERGYLSLALLKEHTKPGENFSERSWKVFSDHNSGTVPFQEAVMLVKGVVLSRKVEQDILVQNMRANVGSVGFLMNCILGLLKDIRLNEVQDSMVLRQVVHQGKSLQEAFDETFNMLRDGLNDIRVGAIKLRQRYAHDPNVLEWVRSCEEFIDGQLHAYSHVVRYGDLGIKIVKLNELC